MEYPPTSEGSSYWPEVAPCALSQTEGILTWGNEDIFSDLLPPESPLLSNDFFQYVEGSYLFPPTPTSTAIDSCANCGGCEFTTDTARGDRVCCDCGMCDQNAPVYGAAPFEKQPEPVSRPKRARSSDRDVEVLGLPGFKARGRRTTHSPYQRLTYVEERLAQWTLTEPGITGQDWEEITNEFSEYVIQRGFIPVIPTGEQLRNSRGSHIARTYVLTKEECRTILENCDIVKDEDSDSMGNVLFQRGHFKRRYYERWLTIRWRFSGVRSLSHPDLVAVVREDFPRLEEAFRHTVGRYERKYFPNYNAMINFLFELYECQDYAEEAFPLPTSLQARNKAEEFWWRFCKYLQWPCLRPSKFLRKRIRRSQNARRIPRADSQKRIQPRPSDRNPTL